jgi:predicted nucleotidyltransferase
MDQILLDTIISRIQAVPSVEAVMLSGSRTAGSLDAHSDTDLYVYWSEAVDAEVRRELAGEFASAMEIDNRFWEPEDLWILKDEQASAHEPGAKPEKVELIYRDYDFLKGELERIHRRCEAWVGYSTCIAANWYTSQILFDRNGRFASLREEFPDEYPADLVQNIINKNYPILADSLSSYHVQIETAVARGDVVSVNHRVAAFLASYFDIIFALNRRWHPGEKKLAKIVDTSGLKVPDGFARSLDKLLFSAGTADPQLLIFIGLMSNHLGELIRQEGYSLPRLRSTIGEDAENADARASEGEPGHEVEGE